MRFEKYQWIDSVSLVNPLSLSTELSEAYDSSYSDFQECLITAPIHFNISSVFFVSSFSSSN